MSLLARYLEAHGLPTVIIGSALDIVEHCAVPRFLFVDFPLGNPCGKPWDRAMQDRIVAEALHLLTQAKSSQTTWYCREEWGDDAWKNAFLAVTDANRAELAAKGEALRQNRAKRVKRELT